MTRSQDRAGRGHPKGSLGGDPALPFRRPWAQSKQALDSSWPCQHSFPLSLSKLTRESGTDFPIPAIPQTDPETEKLIREKDEEVRAIGSRRDGELGSPRLRDHKAPSLLVWEDRDLLLWCIFGPYIGQLVAYLESSSLPRATKALVPGSECGGNSQTLRPP